MKNRQVSTDERFSLKTFFSMLFAPDGFVVEDDENTLQPSDANNYNISESDISELASALKHAEIAEKAVSMPLSAAKSKKPKLEKTKTVKGVPSTGKTSNSIEKSNPEKEKERE